MNRKRTAAATKKRTPAKKRPATAARKPRKRNASLVGSIAQSYLPITDMEQMAKGAKADLKRVAKALNPKRKGRRNPNDGMQGAADLYEDFHGKRSEQITTLIESQRIRSDYAQLGRLIWIDLNTLTGLRAVLEFGDDTHLCSSPDGRQLFILGGDQTVDLGALDMSSDEWMRDSMVLGTAEKITYRTEKGFHDFEEIDYYHKLGEDTGVKPQLVYDTINRRLSLVGGQYLVKPEGIVN